MQLKFDKIFFQNIVKKKLHSHNGHAYRVMFSTTPDPKSFNYFLADNRYKIINIIIDSIKIPFFTYKIGKSGYLHYYEYVIYDTKYQLCLPYNEVEDGKLFYTTTVLERRRLKIEGLKLKLNGTY